MKIFIWNRVNELTDNFHPEGGLVIVADDIERARTLVRTQALGSLEEGLKDPDYIMPVKHNEELYLVFPDAGCC